MWAQHDYEHQGETFTVPTPHNVLPKPFGASHPPIWVACGNPATFAKAGTLGIGAIAFTFEPVPSLAPHIASYKQAAADCTEPLGEYQNNNVMMTAGMVCLSDRRRAREIALEAGRGYLPSMVALYHDTLPERPNSVRWPNPPFQIPDEATLDHLLENGYFLCGDPDDICAQVSRFDHIDIDQLAFGVPAEGLHPDEQLEMIEVFGKQVIPEFDRDPAHSTDRFRETAQPKWPPFNGPVLDISVSVLPSNARVPLPS
jgi:alkanesulfonate monooxygenase SsuD/methylene tetrahydromethanopterin reductase-like flavin-dependent oxidoreductase (luciferase family)